MAEPRLFTIKMIDGTERKLTCRQCAELFGHNERRMRKRLTHSGWRDEARLRQSAQAAQKAVTYRFRKVLTGEQDARMGTSGYRSATDLAPSRRFDRKR